MTVKFCVFTLCALLISIAAAAPAIDKEKFKDVKLQLCKDLFVETQIHAFKKVNVSRFKEGDYLKIQCEVQPTILLENHALYLGEQRLETVTEGKNKITATHYITADDRRKDLRCVVVTAPTRTEDQAGPILALTYTLLDNLNAMNIN